VTVCGLPRSGAYNVDKSLFGNPLSTIIHFFLNFFQSAEISKTIACIGFWLYGVSDEEKYLEIFFKKSLVITCILLSLPSAIKKSGSSKTKTSLFLEILQKKFQKKKKKFGG